MTLQPDDIFRLPLHSDMLSDSSILQKVQMSVVNKGLLTTRKLLQPGNWQQAGSTHSNISSDVPCCCWNRSIGYSFACQEALMHKQRCHIGIGLPTESFHHCVVILTTSAWEHDSITTTCVLKWLKFTSLSYQPIFSVFLCCVEGHLGRLCKADKKVSPLLCILYAHALRFFSRGPGW